MSEVSRRVRSRRDVLRISASVGIATAFTGGLSAALVRQARLHTVRQTRNRMGTIVSITVTHPEEVGARAMIDAAFAEMGRLEARLTRHRPEAPLARLNVEGRIEGAPQELRYVLTEALRVAELSGGAFDPTVLPVLEVWADARARGRGVPSRRDIEAARGHTDFRGVRLVDDVVVLDDPGAAVTLDGIAKGFVVDRTVDRLVAAGAERVLVDAGGDMATGGAESGRDPWTVAVEDPRGAGAPEGLVRLAGGCIATSGDYLHSYTEDRRHHHIIDPRTGYSPEGTSAVTVTARGAMEADALSTAVMVLGGTDGLALLDHFPGAELMAVDKRGARTLSAGFTIART